MQAVVPRARRRLTGRAVALLAVLAVVALSAALPLREFLAQRGDIDELIAQQERTRAAVSALEDERVQLSDPAFIAAEARRRLDFVLPGETAYVLVGPGGALAPAGGSAVADDPPFYAELWDSVRSADRPAAPGAPVASAESTDPGSSGVPSGSEPTHPAGVPTLPPSPAPR